MRTGLSLLSALALAAALVARAQAYTQVDRDSVPEPWCGWWWPMYHPAGVDSCEYCPHLWQGGRYPGPTSLSSIRPIYDLDTRYFWRPESIRDSGQIWEYVNHHYTDTSLRWCGHCGGMSNAQAMEPAPPADCGALSQDDLEGLLAEMDIAVTQNQWVPDAIHTPGTLWYSLQGSFRVADRALVVNFYSNTSSVGADIAWYFPVYWYEVLYDTQIQGGETIADGRMYLRYEDHVYRADHACSTAMYSFSGVVMDSGVYPRPLTGAWGQIRTPPPNLDCPPGLGYTPVGRVDTPSRDNPYVKRHYDTITRVIEHKTIILDDEYMFDALPVLPPYGLWVRRPGYADSCWAVLSTFEYHPSYMVRWSPRLGCDGLWGMYAYKTPPAAGDTLNRSVRVTTNGGLWFFDQSASPYDTWQPLGSATLVGDSLGYVTLDNVGAGPFPYLTYYDALKLEYEGQSGDGGASSAAVKLGDEVPRVRVTPNPVWSNARISYTVPSRGRVHVVVYDVMGRSVLRASQDVQRAGAQAATLSVAGLPFGAYVARVGVAGVHTTCRFVVCR